MARTRKDFERLIDQGLGRSKADLVIKNVRLLNLVTGNLERTDIAICGDRIVGLYDDYSGIEELDAAGAFAVPGFIDTHVHCESTLVTPFEFDRCVLPRGTTTAICDPHEISNVLGVDGLQYFLDASQRLTLDLRVQLSSCVPATHLETSGARLRAEDLIPMMHHPQVLGLAELMNFPGLLHKDPEVLDKLVAFQDGHIDGHAPLLSGKALNAYLACGVRNCHEVTSQKEALEKLKKGMQVLIREGSVSKDVDALAPLIDSRSAPFLGFCTDDRNPLDIAEEGHIDFLIRRAIAMGAPVLDVYRTASWAAASAFGLKDRGLIAPGRLADIVLLDDLNACAVKAVLKAGRMVSEDSFHRSGILPEVGRKSLRLGPVTAADLEIPASGPTAPVIGIVPGSIVTEFLTADMPYRGGKRWADPARDILKVCVLARYGTNRNIGRGFVKGMGLVSGALASSVGHDSHNVCVVGQDEAEMAIAVNRLIAIEGGFVAVKGDAVLAELPLPIAGLMSDRPFEEVESRLRVLREAVRAMGCTLPEPFLQLAFLPLPVIPHLKITDFGMVDVDRFELIAA